MDARLGGIRQLDSFGDTLQNFIIVQANTLEISPASDRVATWSFVGPKLHERLGACLQRSAGLV